MPSTRNSLAAAWEKPTLRHLLEKTDDFVVGVELVTSRGIITERRSRRVLELARRLSEHPRIAALSITDNPGGNAMLSSDTLGTDLIARGQAVIIHLSCKDWNRNALQSRAWMLASEGFNNVLALSGDYPTDGYLGQASPVFDIDSVALIQMLADMNQGLTQDGRNARRLGKTRFYIGSTVNNFKLHESELMPQYFKLEKKINCGAHFIINQLGYDSMKQHELLRYMALRKLDVPVLSNVFVLSAQAAKFFHSGRIPGCVVTDALMAEAQQRADSPDKGKSYFLEFAAKQIAVAKGLGYRGVYLGGHLRFEDYENIFELADSFAPDDWKQFAKEIGYRRHGEFCLFETDPQSGLCSDQINRRYQQSKTPEGMQADRRSTSLFYRLNRYVHDKVFDPNAPGFRTAERIYRRIDAASAPVKRAAHGIEHAAKIAGFDCRDCGDCSLPDIAYLCPESQCVKNQRNGPCGGTRDGLCEVDEKECIWSLAYKRLKPYDQERELIDRPVVIKDASLAGSSAWANTFLRRDHHARQERRDGQEE
jgi:methylenetetrahydrofolate reductase (NADPH)